MAHNQPIWKSVKLTRRQMHVLATSACVSIAMIAMIEIVSSLILARCKGDRRQDGGAQRLTKPGGEWIDRHRLADSMQPISRVWPVQKNPCLLTGSNELAFTRATSAVVHTRYASQHATFHTRHFPHPERAGAVANSAATSASPRGPSSTQPATLIR